MTVCKNCGAKVTENFCPKCGQKADTHRFTTTHIVHDFFHVFTHIDSGLPYLIKELFLRPGTVIREYLEGKRKKYFNPFQYLVLSIAAIVFVMVRFDLGTYIMGNIQFTGSKASAFQAQFIPFLYKYFNIFQFITLPVVSAYSYLFFRKSGYNYAENLVLNTFLSAQRHFVFLITIPFLLLLSGSAKGINSVFMLLWQVYFVWAYLGFFRPKGKAWAVIKTVLISLLFYITTAALLFVMFYFFFFNP